MPPSDEVFAVKRLTPALTTGIMLGIVGLLTAAYLVKHLPSHASPPAALVDDLIPMAIADISPGTLVTESHLGHGPYPKDRLDPDVLRTSRVIAGRYTRETIRSNQPIHANELLPPGESPSLQVGDGMRAVTIEFQEETELVGGIIRPNHFVDVLFTSRGRNGESPERVLTMRLLQGARVLAVKSDVDQRNSRPRHLVSLEVTESEVNMLTLARHHGAIALSLNPHGRSAGEIAESNRERFTLEELLGAKPAERQIATDLYRGSRRATNQFRSDSQLVEIIPSRVRDRAFQSVPHDPTPVMKTAPTPPSQPIEHHEPEDQSPPPTAARILNSPK